MSLKRYGWRWLAIAGAVLAIALVAITPVMAQGGPGEGNITLDKDVKGNQYLFGNAITINSTVDGDVTAFARSLTINGTVNGDILFGGSWLKVNGTVNGDVRGTGAILLLTNGAKVSGDLVAAGYSIEMQSGSKLGGQVLAGAGQLVLNDVAGDVRAAVGGLRINGAVGGNVNASVSSPDSAMTSDPFGGMRAQDPEMPATALVPGGLSFGSDGQIKGNLDYRGPKESQIAAGLIGGKTNFTLEVPAEETPQARQVASFNEFKAVAGYFFASLIVLTITGVILQKAAPNFINGTASTLRQRTLASLGVGILGYIVFFGLLLVLFILIFVLVIPLSFLSMGQRFLGAIFLTSIGGGTLFILVTNWLAPIVVGLLIGELIYRLIEKEKKAPFWSLVIGLVVVLLLISIPAVGRSLIAGLVAVLGMGAAVLYLWPKKQAAPAQAPPAQAAPAK